MYSRRSVSSPMLVGCIFRDLTKFLRLFSRLENVQPKSHYRKMVTECIRTRVTRIELCLTIENEEREREKEKERERVLSLEVKI